MNQQNKLVAAWSAVGTYICLLVVGIMYAPVGALMSEFFGFLVGDMGGVAVEAAAFLEMISTILFLVAVKLPIGIGAGLVIWRFFGRAEGAINYVADTERKSLFKNLFLLVIFEELLARWLFLGVLTHVIPGELGFYTLMLAGNSVWALMHLWNYRHKSQRHPLRVLPQFIGGIFYAFIFLKYGLLASVLAHFASNAVLFAIGKTQNVSAIDGVIVAVHALYALVSCVMMTKPVADTAVWFDGSGTFILPGWMFGDYLLLAILINSCFSLLFDLLLYDKNGVGDVRRQRAEGTKPPSPLGLVLIATLAFAMYLAIIFAVYSLVGIVVTDIPARILVAAILLTFVIKNPSVSAAMRTFWTTLPSTYLFICIVHALGFLGSIGYLFVSLAIAVPQIVLQRFDD